MSTFTKELLHSFLSICKECINILGWYFLLVAFLAFILLLIYLDEYWRMFIKPINANELRNIVYVNGYRGFKPSKYYVSTFEMEQQLKGKYTILMSVFLFSLIVFGFFGTIFLLIT